ncbi:MAG TPA: hypothetical protein ENI87_14445 [bacterium]|nr:hypothetical protein [bacterium]
MSQRRLRRGNWSVQELERLRQLLPQRGVEQTAALLRRTPQSVQRKALDILRMPRRHGAWTDSDDWQLRLAWGALEPPLLAPLLGRPTAEVRARAAELRRNVRTGPWTRAELRLLKKLYGTRLDADLEVCLQRSRAEIAAAATRLCLAKDKRFRAAQERGERAAAPRRAVMPRWSAGEVERLRELYPHHDNLTVARALGRSVTSVANKAHQLGIKKSAALLADIGRSNISCRYAAGPEPAEERPTPDVGRGRTAAEGG